MTRPDRSRGPSSQLNLKSIDLVQVSKFIRLNYSLINPQQFRIHKFYGRRWCSADSGRKQDKSGHALRQVGKFTSHRAHSGLDGLERSGLRRSLIMRRRTGLDRLDNGGPRDLQPLRDARVWNSLSRQPANKCPVFQCDHPSILGVHFSPSKLSSSQASSTPSEIISRWDT